LLKVSFEMQGESLDFKGQRKSSYGMRITEKQMKRMAQFMIEELKSEDFVQFKQKEDIALSRAVAIIKKNFNDEKLLDQEVNQMMDDLERQNAGEFQRYKMFPMLKKKIAEQKGFVL
jgi:hypothetical protein